MSNTSGRSLVGTQIGSYQVRSLIGAGGMGEVYRATDERLGRDVAIKILSAAAQHDGNWRDRLDREARLLASINHPHIAAIYGVEQVDGAPALVLELVEGPTLATHLRQGALPVAEAVKLARQIAEALEAAHGKGVIHRDLKPGNIVVAEDGGAKVLDFGLAKAVGSTAAHDVTKTALTSEGAVMGTVAYMSPEQARGLTVDEQTDVWAFGCVLFEMLTGRRAFSGETASDTIAALLKGDPDWTLLPPGTPAHVTRVIRRSLEKDPRRRLHSIADARIELEDEPGSAPIPSGAPRATATRALAGATLVIIALGAGYWASVLMPSDTRPLSVQARFGIAVAGEEFIDGQGVAISADGSTVAYVSGVNGVRRIAVRRLDRLDAQLLTGTEGATQPFFSPDGRWIAFFAGGKLRKVPIVGGTSEVITDALSPRGGAWGPDDTIVFAPQPFGVLVRVAASGGTPEPLTKLGPREASHRYPQFLPGGKTIVYGAGPPGTVVLWSEASIVIESLVEPDKRTVIGRGTSPRYLAPGHLVYVQLTQLYAVPIDIANARVTGPPVPLDEHVSQMSSGFAQYDIASNGTLASAPTGYIPTGTLALVNRSGAIQPLNIRVAYQSEPRISPDGSKIAYTASTPDAEVWIYDVKQHTARQLTTGGGNVWPAWSPDGQRIAYSSFRFGIASAFARDVNGGPEQELDRAGLLEEYLRDGTIVLRHSQDETDHWMLAAGATTPRPMPILPPRETMARFSPDGKLVATVSSETGRAEVVVYPYPQPGERIQVSTDGGGEPVFARDGRALFYRRGADMMMSEITSGPPLRFGTPRLLFKGPTFSGPGNRANFDVMPDGQTFLMVQLDEARPTTRLVVTEDWRGSIGGKLGK